MVWTDPGSLSTASVARTHGGGNIAPPGPGLTRDSPADMRVSACRSERREESAQLTGDLLWYLVCHEVPAAVRCAPVAQVGEDAFGQVPGVGRLGRLVAQGDRRGHGDLGDGLIRLVVVVLAER